jgi:soluble lytic murein transglycosylase
MIPYDQTRNYVQRVLENVQIYRLRLGEAQVASSLESDLAR